MADPKRTYYPGPGILSAVNVSTGPGRTRFSVSRGEVTFLRVETGSCVLMVPFDRRELVAMRDMLTEVIDDTDAAAIPVGEATDSDHGALAEIGSAA